MRSKNYVFLPFFMLLFLLFSMSLAQNILVNGDLETVEPGFWSKLNDGMGGAQVTWATDEAVDNSLRSFKIIKASATTDMVGWVSDNNADLYWNNAGGNDLYNLGFWAKTDNVNTSPANQDAMIGVWFKFYASGALLGEQFVAVDQTTASVDWTEYTAGLLVPSEPDSVVAVAVMGKDATGTVWFDNYACNTNAGWTMGIFNGDAETPLGWMQWASGSDVGYVALTEDPDAYSGSYDALLVEKDTLGDEIVFYSEPGACDARKWYLLSVWIKTDSINTSADYYPTNAMGHFDDHRMGVCFFFHRSPLKSNWDLTGGDQFYYVDQTADSAGWTRYAAFAQAPEDAAGVSMRARFNNFPTGYAWYDDFQIIEVPDILVTIEEPGTRVSTLTNDFLLRQNYPNPFNPETIIEYLVPKRGMVELNIYNLLGQKIRSLLNEEKPAGTYQILWDGRDDYGNQVATGMYLYQLRGENAFITKKMILIK